MMGSSGGTEFGNVFDLISTLENPGAYEKKLGELGKRVQEAQRTLAQATEESRKAEAINKVASEMLAAADKKIEEANQIKKEQDTRSANIDSKVAEHNKATAQHDSKVAEFENYRVKTEADLAAKAKATAQREAAVNAGEQAVNDTRQRAEAELTGKRHAIENERSSVLQAAAAQLERANAVRADAEKFANSIVQHQRAVEEIYKKLPAVSQPQ